MSDVGMTAHEREMAEAAHLAAGEDQWVAAREGRDLREQVTRAIHGAMESAATPIGRISVSGLADAVMRVATPVVELRERLAVAEELRRQADQIMAAVDQVAGDPDEGIYLDSATTHAHMLRKRADALDPEGAAK